MYVHGQNPSGSGALHLAAKYPERFAAAVISSGPIVLDTYPFEKLKGKVALVERRRSHAHEHLTGGSGRRPRHGFQREAECLAVAFELVLPDRLWARSAILGMEYGTRQRDEDQDMFHGSHSSGEGTIHSR